MAGANLGKAMEGSDGLFFPSMFSDAPFNAQTGASNTSNTSATGPGSVRSNVGKTDTNGGAVGTGMNLDLGMGDIDIEAFLSQITNAEGGVDFNLDALFGGSTNGAGQMEIMELTRLDQKGSWSC